MQLPKEIYLSDLEDQTPDFESSISKAKDLAADVGIYLPENLITDGSIHRFSVNDKPNKEDGYYALHQTKFGITGIAGDFTRSFGNGENHITIKAFGHPLSNSEHIEMLNLIKKSIEEKKALKEKKQEKAAESVSIIWESAGFSDPDHPYLKKKGLLSSHGSRITGDGRLIVPLYSEDGEIKSLQYISHDGVKRYHPGGKTGGCYWILGDIKDKVYITEGFATGATIRDEIEAPVVIAYSANNLPHVAEKIRELHPEIKIIIVADNDKSGTGENYANQAASKSNCSVILPPQIGDINDYKLSGGDIKIILTENSILEKYGAYYSNNLPKEAIIPDEIIQGVFISKAVGIIYGASNTGKTFFVLSAARAISNGLEFHGKKVDQGVVLYFATESPEGIQLRMQALRDYHGEAIENVIVIPTPINLFKENNQENDIIEMVKEAEEARGLKVKMMIFDTLAQISAGANENSDEMSTVMIKLTHIANKSGASVIAIHHLGKDTTKGLRGWSGITGHIDTALEITEDEEIRTVTATKQRDLPKGSQLFFKLDIVPMGIGKFGDNFDTCVAVESQEKPTKKEKKKDSKKDKFIGTFKRAWFDSGAEILNDRVYLSRSALQQKLLSEGRSPRTVKNDLNPSYEDKLIGHLISNEVISTREHGWVILNSTVNASLILAKNNEP